MNLLIITSNLPYPLNTGGNQAQYNVIDYLRNKGINITIVFNQNNINNNSNLKKLNKLWDNVVFYPYNWKSNNNFLDVLSSKIFKKLYNKYISNDYPFNRTDVDLALEYTEDFIDFIQKIIVDKQIELLQIDFRHFLPLIYSIPKSIKTVFIQHEIQFIRNKLTFELTGRESSFQNFLIKKMMSDEIAAMNEFDLIITLTDIDKRILKENGVTSIIKSSPAAITNFSMTNKFISCDDHLVFIGGSNHFPNKHGLLWFLNQVWHQVLELKPEIKLDIVGSWKKKEQIELEKKFKNIRFLGFIEDLSSVLSKAVMIVPIKIGSGMRMKIVEAANFGCPFITTSVGVEGLNFNNNQNCFIEDDELLFAIKVIELVENKALQKQFSINSKETFERNYSANILGQRRFSLLDCLSQKHIQPYN